MNTSKNYPGQNALISYLKKQGNKSSYCRFLNLHHNFIVTSIFSDNWKDLDNTWFTHFLEEVERLDLNKVLKEKINTEHLRYMQYLQTFWQKIIKEYKENLEPINTSNSIKVQAKQKEKLKRLRDDDTTESSEYWKRQSQILEQNKNNLVYRQVIDNALLVILAYESLIEDNIIPFIKILKTSLLLRSRMSLSSANEPVLQAIVENLLPSEYCIPEFSLVINGKKPKGSGHFGYSDIFVLSNIGNNNVILELKYISLVGLNRNQKNNLGANELENLDKLLEKENEESILKRPYSYWSKEDKKMNLTTIGEILNNGMNQLSLYMKTISKGRAMNYSSSGVFDERVKISKSNPNKLKGFVILVIGFRRILWRSVDEVTTNYTYNKV
ncbi:unnamed protein product [Rhizophagus irregularis]|uniref:Uncharacterized protein n=1 Tax=Rhizophagus irregularis TaxID=588596 RepID=A0A916EFK6_9GLOM|nr:unnamed protein product [Rhizophagus irregularis]CAB5189212.1 unnamed protein product [Rhizophagus irregularis]CAB5384255.1 unnamed protein product [Rhizophagus irregularis]